ncbi:MAG: hypothetical protein GX757_06325, partial [Clostridiales bacterium]|nr:hypothetical protein [Clostridiales bacterium]
RLAMSMGIDVSKINWDVELNKSYAAGRNQEDESLVQKTEGSARTEEQYDSAGELDGEDKPDNFNYFIEEEKARESDIEYGE